MTIDNIGVIGDEGERIVVALEANAHEPIPWSDSWTVAKCAQHVGGVHHVVTQVIRDRPTADFGLFSTLAIPSRDDPLLGEWVASGTTALVEQLRVTDDVAECWSWWPEGRTARFWQRRMAQETSVHRWDVEQGAGLRGEPMDPELAADGIDEYLDVFASLTRGLHKAPAGPSVHVHCTDNEGEWLVRLPAEGERTVTREHAKADVALRGPAEGLLLFLWGRLAPSVAGVDVVGNTDVVQRWGELFPSM